jgi:hypothetical protein
MKKICVAMMVALMATCAMAVVNVDFMEQYGGAPLFVGQGAYSDPGNDYWNEYRLHAGVVSNLVKSDGVTPSTIDIEFVFPASTVGTAGNDMFADVIFVGESEGGTYTVSGLPANQPCQFYLYLRGNVDNQIGTMTLNDVTVTQTVASLSPDYILNENTFIAIVNADASGVISGTFETTGAAPFACIAGMQMIPIPEPGTLVLVGLAVLGILRLRK